MKLSVLIHLLLCFLLLLSGVYAWFSFVYPQANLHFSTLEEYQVKGDFNLSFSSLTFYPNQTISTKLIYKNEGSHPLSVYRQISSISHIYEHEFYDLNAQTTPYSGEDRFDETYWGVPQYYLGQSDYKIPSNLISKEYFKNFISPLVNALIHLEANTPLKEISFPPLVIPPDSVIEEPFSLFFSPLIYSHFGEVELRNSNPYLFQTISIKFKVTFDYQEAI